MRLMEALRLRVKDVTLQAHRIPPQQRQGLKESSGGATGEASVARWIARREF